MLDFGKAKRYERSLFPMTRESFYERNALSRKAIEEDQLLTQKEAQAYFAKKHAK
ncbi:MAG: hypothetical protein RLO12_21915 [Fulvivirga sp.]